MLLPSANVFNNLFEDDFFNNFFDSPFRAMKSYSPATEMMKTDVKETENGYELSIGLPGVKKEDIQAELKDGYLTINATTNSENEEKDEKGKYIRRERYSGSASRSFYVGEDVHEDEIKAKYENGVLTLDIPKKEEKKPEVEQKKYIAIEG
ncbi:MAG: Hsp20/alpha crystallin family protein [Lachnospiraceae bacterium]|nr:Hsp20/alpha crystallin family protein [Lachnospiraceae bacterium]